MTLLRHVIRSHKDDPMKQVTFEDEHLRTIFLGTRRPGRPRQKWIENTMKEAWSKAREDTKPYMATIERRQLIAKTAENREGQFKTKLKNNKEDNDDSKKKDPQDEKWIDISKRKVVSEDLASRFVRGKYLKTVDLTTMYAAL